jgi:hypothetical protein
VHGRMVTAPSNGATLFKCNSCKDSLQDRRRLHPNSDFGIKQGLVSH